MDNLCSKSSNVLLTEVNAFYFYVKSLQNKNILCSKPFFSKSSILRFILWFHQTVIRELQQMKNSVKPMIHSILEFISISRNISSFCWAFFLMTFTLEKALALTLHFKLCNILHAFGSKENLFHHCRIQLCCIIVSSCDSSI